MNTVTAPSQASTPDSAGSPGLSVQSIARLVASTLCGIHKVNGQFVSVNATVGEDGYIDVDVTQLDFTASDVTVRVLLYPTAAEPGPPRFAPDPRNAA